MIFVINYMTCNLSNTFICTSTAVIIRTGDCRTTLPCFVYNNCAPDRHTSWPQPKLVVAILKQALYKSDINVLQKCTKILMLIGVLFLSTTNWLHKFIIKCN